MDLGMIELQAAARQQELLHEVRMGRRAPAVAPEGTLLPAPRALATLVGIIALAVALAFGSGLAAANAQIAVAGGGGNAIGYAPKRPDCVDNDGGAGHMWPGVQPRGLAA